MLLRDNSHNVTPCPPTLAAGGLQGLSVLLFTDPVYIIYILYCLRQIKLITVIHSL